MVCVIILFRVREPFPLRGEGVYDDRPIVDLLRLFQGGDQHRHVVPVHVTDVLEAQFVHESPRQDRGGDGVFERFSGPSQRFAYAGNTPESVADLFFQVLIALCFLDPVQVTAQCSHGRGDRHFVVVEQYDHPRFQMPGLVNRLHRHTARERRIPDKGADVEIFILQIAGDGHAQSGRNGRGCVPGTERIVFGFVTAKKSAQAAWLLDRVQLVSAPGKDLVGVRLVPHVPNQTVTRRVEHVVHRDGQLDGSETGARVAADSRTGVDYERPDLVRDLLQVLDL